MVGVRSVLDPATVDQPPLPVDIGPLQPDQFTRPEAMDVAEQNHKRIPKSVASMLSDPDSRNHYPPSPSANSPGSRKGLGRSDFLALGGGSARGSYAVRAEGATVTAREPDIAVPRLC